MLGSRTRTPKPLGPLPDFFLGEGISEGEEMRGGKEGGRGGEGRGGKERRIGRCTWHKSRDVHEIRFHFRGVSGGLLCRG